MLYYRGTCHNNPMSDWGHAMFTDDLDKAYFDPYSGRGYGWILDSEDCTPIDSIKQLIINTWQHDIDTDFEECFGYIPDKYILECTPDEIANLFNPTDIVDSANAWDSDLVAWFWERIAEPHGIMAISTRDGAICFDDALIKAFNNAVA